MARDPDGRSPFNLFQETYSTEPWRLLCCVIMLNQTSGKQLEPVHEELFSRWPTALHLTTASVDEVESVVRPLGLQCRRARQLIRMSAAYSSLWDGTDPQELPGIGKYGCHSYLIFIRGAVDIDVEDKELRRYLEWARGS